MGSGDAPARFWTRLFDSVTDAEAGELTRAASAGDVRREDELLLAWRAHREACARDEVALEARVRELEALQSLGRALAEARSIDELIRGCAAAIETVLEFDAVAVAVALPEHTGVDVLVARPFDAAATTRLAAMSAEGLLPGDTPVTARPTGRFDAFQGSRGRFRPEDVIAVPIARRGREAMRIAVLPTGAFGDRERRLLFGASNHVALHLDRVLAVAEAEQGRFRAILDSMPHAVVLTDTSLRVVQANASAARLTAGWPSAAEALRSVGDLDLAALGYGVLSGRRQDAAGEAVLEDGTHLEVSLSPWKGGTGSVDGLVVVMLDVTTAHRLREQIAQSEKLGSLGRMIAGVAHEINNPLTSVIGYAQLLRGSPPGDKTQERLETIRREAERCRRIVQNLLRFARTHPPERRPFSLNEMAEGVTQLLAYPVRAAGSRIELELAPDLPAVVGDVHAIEQAVVNLVTNAQQALAEAGRPGVIVIRTRGDGAGRPVLEVEDDGPGVPEVLRARVFDPFFTTKAVGSGTGLGLWLVYNAVTASGGHVALGEGTRGGALFRLTLAPGAPLPKPRDEALDPFPDAPRVSARILVLDSEAALASLICEALEGEGHAAVAAHDASAGLSRLAHERFDLVVSDVALPGLPGDRLARELTRVGPDRRSRILLTTGDWISREPETLARSVGAGLLRKPFEIDELRRVVRKQLAREPES